MVTKTILDSSTEGILYVGEAICGSLTNEAKWHIQKITTSAGITSVECANGKVSFDNVWDNRALLSYQ